jgi:hypothetical protein
MSVVEPVQLKQTAPDSREPTMWEASLESMVEGGVLVAGGLHEPCVQSARPTHGQIGLPGAWAGGVAAGSPRAARAGAVRACQSERQASRRKRV